MEDVVTCENGMPRQCPLPFKTTLIQLTIGSWVRVPPAPQSEGARRAAGSSAGLADLATRPWPVVGHHRVVPHGGGVVHRLPVRPGMSDGASTIAREHVEQYLADMRLTDDGEIPRSP